MEAFGSVILYLAFVRVAVISSGAICIILGYRLFLHGFFGGAQSSKREKEEIAAEFPGVKLTLRNAAPGTAFALFGAGIIAAMIFSGPPEVSVDKLDNGATKVTMRDSQNKQLAASSEQALQFLKRNDKIKAVSSTNTALNDLAPVLNDFAWVLLKADSKSTAMELLARTATTIRPMEPDFLDTLAEILYQNGEKKEAIRTLEAAQNIRPAFTDLLDKWRNESP
jgi:hypothetical protein